VLSIHFVATHLEGYAGEEIAEIVGAPAGTINKISPWLTSGGSGGIGINSLGQVALTARIDKGPEALLLLTPKAP
jgi:hypothetical protein